MTRLFVYGTLKRGHGNNVLLDKATFVGRCIISTHYTLHSLGGFPGLVRTKREQPGIVGGEVWEVDDLTLRRVDQLEGHPEWYTREEVQTPFGVAWTYTLPENYAVRPRVRTPFWEQNEEETAFLVEGQW